MITPRGGRMGIPKCGGMHGIMAEDRCLDCQQLTLEQERNKQLKRHADLLEESVELQREAQFWGHRASERPMSPRPPKPKQVDSKEIIVKGGMEVRARRPSTST